MRLLDAVRRRLQMRSRNPAGQWSDPGVQQKRDEEMRFWLWRAAKEGALRNAHYEAIWTTVFGQELSFYNGKRLLDVGCGPRGSLEWAHGARQRVGLDPLSAAYRDLGTAKHRMQYVCGAAECMPFGDNAFDVVTSINSLDHVEDLDRTIAELVRVTAPGGVLFVLVEVHPRPTATEPIALPWTITRQFAPLVVERELQLERDHGVAWPAQIAQGRPFDHANPSERVGVLLAQMRKTAA
jgi:SAM-dependent methyltransferase